MKINKIIILIFFILGITGCVNYTELNELGIIDMIIISKENDTWLLDITMVIPEEEDKNNSVNYHVTGSTLGQAINNIYLTSSKEVYLSHLNLLALTPSLAKEDIIDIINFFLERTDSRNTFYVVNLNNYKKNKEYISKDIINLINSNYEEKSTVKLIQFDQVIKDIMEIETSYIPSIDENFNIVGYNKIYENTKHLDINESFAFNILSNKIEQAYINIKNDINIKIQHMNTRITVDKNKLNILINSVITNNKKEYNNYINELIKNFLKNNTYEYFNNLVKKYDYYYYKDNKNIQLEFDINFNTTVNDSSSTKGEINYD